MYNLFKILYTYTKFTLKITYYHLFEIDIKNVTYASNADFEIPVELDATMFFDPVTMSMYISRNTTTSFNARFEMTDADLCLYRLEVDVETADDDLENLTEDSIEKLEAKLTIGAMSIQSLANAAQLISMDDPSENEVNSLLDLDVLFISLLNYI